MQLHIFFLYILCHTYSTLYMIQPETMKHEFAKTLRTAHTDSLTDKKPRKTQVYKCETGRKQLWQYQTNKNKIRRERMVDEQRKRGTDSRRERERGGILEGISDPHHTPALSITFITAAISGEVFRTGEWEPGCYASWGIRDYVSRLGSPSYENCRDDLKHTVDRK